MVPRIYLDHNATTPLLPDARQAMAPYLADEFGNASSLHAWGRAARAAVAAARAQIAGALRCVPDEVVFTGGGTEADNLAVLGAVGAARADRRHIVTTAIEHYAVLRPARQLQRLGCQVVYVRPNAEGLIEPGAVAAAVDDRTCLISVMHANNETGVIQPVAAIGELAWHRGIAFHVDAVQSLGRLSVDPGRMGADLVSVSAHKVNGPKGVGALYVRRGMDLEAILHGGAQERGRRAGTENVAGIVGFGRAVAARAHPPAAGEDQCRRLRDRLEQGILGRVAGVRVNGHVQRRLANTSNLSFAGVRSRELVGLLDQEGIAVASGSACAAESPSPSHVLLAMGRSAAEADGAVRFSLGWGNTEAKIDRVLEVLPECVRRLRAGGR